MKVKEKVRSRAIFILLLVSFIILLLTNSVYADEGTIEYRGKITSGDSTVGEFYVDGRIAFCVDHAKPTPPNRNTNSQKKCLFRSKRHQMFILWMGRSWTMEWLYK